MRILDDRRGPKRGLGPSQGVRGGTGEAPRRHQGSTGEVPRMHLVGSNHEKVVEIYKLTLQALSDKFNVCTSRCGWAGKQEC